ncbi:unnamed protein product [Rotaria sordida]|uniref:Uncharacterized protein n=1 Tax=Rotaria sordida TaxID=392033 RepID=A0A813MXD0_9BILA|nr:unnamed protein product [Rotaria sordida]
MKKIVTLLAVGAVAMFYACGPSAEEKALKEKAKNDSIALAEAKAKMEQDSLANVMRVADSIANATRIADSLANLPKGGGKKTTTPTKTKDEKNLDQIKDLKGGTKTPAEKKKDEENIKTIKGLKGGN